ncbi:MAG: cupin domain-containing protein [Gemmatimonadetes bacterium]|nr:cupin domain-containing protein [Gemmatimonadota bacterium]
MVRPAIHLLLCVTLLGCGRIDPSQEETSLPAAAGGRVSSHADCAHPSQHTEVFDTLTDRVAGVAARYAGDPRAPRLLPLRPMTPYSEILFGDPSAEGEPFVIRIREAPGFIVPPHSHTVDEQITVVQGTWYYGIGELFDSTKLQALPAGSYAFAPAGTMMFAYSPEPAVVQVHGIGPFNTHWKHGMIALEDAGADTVFRFRMGEMVSTPRGDGRIRWGGASGALIQYDIERADGSIQAHRPDLETASPIGPAVSLLAPVAAGLAVDPHRNPQCARLIGQIADTRACAPFLVERKESTLVCQVVDEQRDLPVSPQQRSPEVEQIVCWQFGVEGKSRLGEGTANSVIAEGIQIDAPETRRQVADLRKARADVLKAAGYRSDGPGCDRPAVGDGACGLQLRYARQPIAFRHTRYSGKCRLQLGVGVATRERHVEVLVRGQIQFGLQTLATRLRHIEDQAR